MKILNLFSGIGGNRKLWEGEITAVEIDPIIAQCYLDNFPDDEMIIRDVLEFLQNQDLNQYDFIWASPPCVSHSQWNMTRGYTIPNLTQIYGLYLFFKYKYPRIKWVIENVRPWYKPLIKPSFKIHRHYFWSDFTVPTMNNKHLLSGGRLAFLSFKQLTEYYKLNTTRIKNLEQLKRRQIVRNCIHPEIANHILTKHKEQKLIDFF